MKEIISFEQVLNQAVQVPLVKIDRNNFLRRELTARIGDCEIVECAVQHNPAYAGISLEIIDSIALTCIDYETKKVSIMSCAAGIPGGVAIVATVPVDLVQYLAHILRIAQKLAYLYGWDDFCDSSGNMTDETLSILTLFVGVMFSVNGATSAITKLSANAAEKVTKQLAAKALTKGTLYPIVKQIAKALGIKMTKEIFAKTVGKIIPVVGGVMSGGITYLMYKPMSKRLMSHLRTLKYCDVNFYKQDREASI